MKKTCVQCAISLETINSSQKNMIQWKKNKKVRIYDNTIQFGTKYDINKVL